ncbi:flagellar protein FliT [Brevibacillus borstelensis]|uniref:flagellar protein FliT n=1 Tax=Brevibacillus borstelensis TaxID=45462 RepID=UPI00148FE2A3|nr:flagellar protein FliT [Brevibacillus borstelensis]MCC0566459.1 flagellar protein FliT [Brevibacillus borstelensis]MCM3470984.1 flagellar protein FliT [Brevibacillus borstelensis]MCM3559952.1 flagellar protein FliT [Brevibacillus borstelensis]MCM3623105.1 flagellar protein FliT [Brevibacillus borstelensis]NOU58019.1 flagellar protein FliT [Brevibacillus borstelensis]
MTLQSDMENLESLFRELLRLSREWERAVLQEEADPDEWVELLDQREQVIRQIDEAMRAGAVPREEWKQQYVEPTFELDQRLIEVMEEKKDRLSEKINQIKQGKTVNKQYLGYGTSAYGAFFDKKK